MSYDEKEAREIAASMNAEIYHIFLFKKGPTWKPDPSPEVDALQEKHLANLKRLGELGKLVLNGPLLDSFAIGGEIRGIGVLKTATMKEAQALLDSDPMVQSKRLIYEIHAWMVGKGILP
jgi:uncharacterized protein YciI